MRENKNDNDRHLPRRRKGTHNQISLLNSLDLITDLNNMTSDFMAHYEARARRLDTAVSMKVTDFRLVKDSRCLMHPKGARREEFLSYLPQRAVYVTFRMISCASWI